MLYRRALKGLYHTTVYCIGILVLVAAVGVTLIRLALPDIGQYRGEVEAWVSKYMGYPVVIHSMRANWEGWIPHLYLTDIDLLNKAGTHKITGFDKAQIEIDPIRTLVERQFMPRHLVISGLQLSVARLSSGAIFIEGVNIGEQGSGGNDRSEIADWLFKQDKIVIQNAKIEWIDVKHNQEPILLSDVTLELKTDDDRIQVDGYCELPIKFGKSMNFAFDAVGNILSSNWSGDLYLEANDINPDNWYRKYRPAGITIAGGNANIKAWSYWLDSRMANIEGQLSYNDFAAQSGEESLHIEELAYSFKGERNRDKDWHFQVLLDSLLTENGYWPESRFEVAAVKTNHDDSDYRLAFTFDYLKLDDLTPLLSQLDDIPEEARETILSGDISGELSSGTAVYERKKDANDIFFYDVAFDNLQTNFSDNLPNISGFAGRISGSNDNLLVNLKNENLRFMFPDHMQPDIALTQLNGSVYAERIGEQWLVHTDDLVLGNEDHTVKLQANINSDTYDGKPELNLFADLSSNKLDKLHEIVPSSDKFKLKDWLKKTIQGGNLDSAQFVFRGNPASFPFRKNDGQFQALVNVSDTILEYSHRWPIIDELTAEVLVDNEEVKTTVVSGHMLDANILSNSSMHILDLTQKPKMIELKGQIAGAVTDLNDFINTSPLSNHRILAPATKNISGGEIDVDVEILMAVRSKKIRPKINGTISFSDTTLTTKDKRIRIDKITGPVEFTRGSVTADKLSAELDGHPVALSITGPEGAANHNQVGAITLSGKSDQDFVTAQMQKRLPNMEHFSQTLNKRMQGEMQWQAEVAYVKSDDKIEQHLTLSSDLHGMAIDLPTPVGKSTWDRKHISVKKQLYNSLAATMNYNDEMHVAFINSPETKKLQQLHVSFGSDQLYPATPVIPGMFIDGSIDKLAFKDWFTAIKAFSQNESEGEGDGTGGFVSRNDIVVDLDVDDFNFYGQHFTYMHIDAERKHGAWLISPTSFDASGVVTIPAKFNDNYQISANLDKLILKKNARGNGLDEQQATALDPATFPALDIQVDDFVFRDMELGELKLVALRDDNGLTIDNITIGKPGLNISGYGTWSGSINSNLSSFTAELHAEEIGAMLETFNYDGSPMKKGETTIQLQAEWAGSPMDFTLDKVNGNLELAISKGQILEVDPSAGRLFGLLSLQTLPRRLSLDFSDLLGKGLAFDKIEGNFDISHGNAYTNDLRLTGPAADVNISGRTGLAQQDYDQIVTVTPQVSNTLPVASALFGPVGIGVGAVLYLAGNMFESINNSIDSILSYQYTITGPWENPNIEKLKSRNPEEQGQSQISQLPDSVTTEY